VTVAKLDVVDLSAAKFIFDLGHGNDAEGAAELHIGDASARHDPLHLCIMRDALQRCYANASADTQFLSEGVGTHA
jgi:hypothetical protein